MQETTVYETMNGNHNQDWSQKQFNMKQQITCELTLSATFIYLHKPLFSSLDQKATFL